MVAGRAPSNYNASTPRVPVLTNQRRGQCSARGQYSARGHQRGDAQAGGEAPIPEIVFTGNNDTAFYTHHFITGERETEAEVKCHYALAHTRDPLTQQEDHWVGVNYNSKYDGIGMNTNTNGRPSNRPALNLVVALDISGSMGDTFKSDDETGDSTQKKLQVAKDCLLALLSQLHDDDAFGLVLFNSKATVLQPLTKWSELNKAELEAAILKLRSSGGTELTEGNFKNYSIAHKRMLS